MIDNQIIKIASDTKNYGLKNNFTHYSNYKNHVCGDKIKIQIIKKKEKILSMRYETESCILCQASASILSKKINLFSSKSLKKDYLILRNSNNKLKIPNKFKPFKLLLKKNKNRIDCVALPFKALMKALGKRI
ncbi:MAG: hypothetical protein CBD76_02700 [Pelagibacteraceae bacterium TMED216]|nr:MAG: hypothetical protein CBD76_02700 [Pelagibacteraceae bacterium TMED216]|tara:strand:+ start:1294 stop:1692 length:399 start_codon:yes stop_codon:yes gene_type:complete